MMAIIFDLDGLAVDSEKLWEKADEFILKDAGGKLTSRDKKYVMGRDVKTVMQYYKKRFGLKGNPEFLNKKRIRFVCKLYQKQLKPMPGFLPLAKRLCKNYKLALASGGPSAVVKCAVKKLNLDRYFCVVVCSDDVKRGKPEPDIFLEAARRLRVVPEQCVVFEDSPNGVKAAKRAGMKCVAIPYKKAGLCKKDFKQADWIFNNLKEADKLFL